MRIHGGGLFQVFTLFVPKPLEPDHVPQAIKQAVEAGVRGRNLKWYAASQTAGEVFTAVDYEGDDPPEGQHAVGGRLDIEHEQRERKHNESQPRPVRVQRAQRIERQQQAD